ncbi:MAG: SGNH/GDSL hydrolase family protein [Anaerolineae bacterium]|nr:SGNH/GDSL hydrolase family protein [Anaerolineae bacterium]
MFARIAPALVGLIILSGSIPHPAAANDPVHDVLQTAIAHIDLNAYPILPDAFGIAAEIFARGQTQGRDPNALSKVGDCNSAEWLFLHPFAAGQYDLGDYAYLQPVIEVYAASFDVRSQATHNGLTVAAARDPQWANPAHCEPGETPLTCEYRLRNPALALIMFGSNDMFALTPDQFDANLRQLIAETLDASIVPILSTFPRHLQFADRSIEFNQIVVQVALDYDIPLINLWLALEPLPYHGIAADDYHLNGPYTQAGDFTSETNLRTGYPMRNLVTLQALDRVWRAVTGEK